MVLGVGDIDTVASGSPHTIQEGDKWKKKKKNPKTPTLKSNIKNPPWRGEVLKEITGSCKGAEAGRGGGWGEGVAARACQKRFSEEDQSLQWDLNSKWELAGEGVVPKEANRKYRGQNLDRTVCAEPCG